jgi:hypothetical protein
MKYISVVEQLGSMPLGEAIEKASFFWTLSKRGRGFNRNPKV